MRPDEYVGWSVANYSHSEWAKFEEVKELGGFLQGRGNGCKAADAQAAGRMELQEEE